ncbi:MAG TPA: hypothetical protein VK142_00640 [Bacillota bacterium]|nr:hypothetical protein [Bacillota bacterium]
MMEQVILYMEWINMQKLAILGMQKEHIYTVSLTIGMCIAYFTIRPIILWLLIKNFYKLLTYVISSLFILVILLFLAHMEKGVGGLDFTLLIKYALLTLTMFGCVLLTSNLLLFFFKKWFKKSV